MNTTAHELALALYALLEAQEESADDAIPGRFVALRGAEDRYEAAVLASVAARWDASRLSVPSLDNP